jgi:2-polyprenyl-3-methyl-5-hydroxy-6-metoxy-1,4-benzoquinol methylase
MERREKLIGGVDLTNSVVAEIGALCNPMVKKSEADVRYVDYADAKKLRAHYANNPHIDPERIVETDAIWGKDTLLAALKQPVDLIVASHVVEHVPDLIAWFDELHLALAPTGQVALAIPDRRFTFDFLRRETSLSDVLAVHLSLPRVPQPHQILDYYLNATEVDAAAAWRMEVNEQTLQRPDNYQAAMSMAKDALSNGTYHDAHCWVFTPQSFATLLEALGRLGLVHFACDDFHDTAYGSIEFFVRMKPSTNVDEIAASWARMAAGVRVHDPQALSALDRAPIQLGRVEGLKRKLSAAQKAFNTLLQKITS